MAEQNSRLLLSAEDAQYRKQSMWHAFKASLYTAVSGASFFGALNNLVGMAVNGISTAGANTTTMASLLEKTFGLGLPAGVVTGGIMVGLGVLGVAATYLAQREWTELKVLDADRLARKNAECMGINGHASPEKTAACGVAFEQNQRADGRTWQEVMGRPKTQISTQIQ